MTLQEEKQLLEDLLTQTTNEYILTDINKFIDLIEGEINGDIRGDRPNADDFKNNLLLMNQL